jgi:hypothetical protein
MFPNTTLVKPGKANGAAQQKADNHSTAEQRTSEPCALIIALPKPHGETKTEWNREPEQQTDVQLFLHIFRRNEKMEKPAPTRAADPAPRRTNDAGEFEVSVMVTFPKWGIPTSLITLPERRLIGSKAMVIVRLPGVNRPLTHDLPRFQTANRSPDVSIEGSSKVGAMRSPPRFSVEHSLPVPLSQVFA